MGSTNRIVSWDKRKDKSFSKIPKRVPNAAARPAGETPGADALVDLAGKGSLFVDNIIVTLFVSGSWRPWCRGPQRPQNKRINDDVRFLLTNHISHIKTARHHPDVWFLRSVANTRHYGNCTVNK